MPDDQQIPKNVNTVGNDTSPTTLVSHILMERACSFQPDAPDYLVNLLSICSLLESIVLHERLLVIDQHEARRQYLGEVFIPSGGYGGSDYDDEGNEEAVKEAEEAQQFYDQKLIESLLSNKVKNNDLLAQLFESQECPISFIGGYEDRNQEMIESGYDAIKWFALHKKLRGEECDSNDLLDSYYKYVSMEVSRLETNGQSFESWKKQVENANKLNICLYERRVAQSFGHSYVTDYSLFSKLATEISEQQDKTIVTEMVKAYKDLSSILDKKQHRVMERRPQKFIQIPPIALIIFSRAARVNDIILKTLELREEMSELRTTLLDYERIIRDDSLPIGQTSAAIDQLDGNIKIICQKLEKGSSLDITELRSGVDFAKAMSDGFDSDDSFTISKLFLGKPVNWLIKRLKTRNVHYFYQLGKEFLNNPNFQYVSPKLFGREITREDLERAKTSQWTAGYFGTQNSSKGSTNLSGDQS